MAAGSLAIPAGVAGAATITVDHSTDDGMPGSLRWAVDQANAGGGATTIDLPASTYVLSRCGADDTDAGGDLDHTASQPLTLAASGGPAIVLQTCGDERVLDDRGGATLTIRGVSVVGGTGRDAGGAVRASGPVVLDAAGFAGNRVTGSIGAPASGATPPAMGGEGAGGAVYAGETLTVTNSTFRANQAVGGAGGQGVVAGEPATAGDGGPGRGGALAADGAISVTGSTFDGNTAQGGIPGSTAATARDGGLGEGGAIAAHAGAPVTVTGSSFTGQQAWGGPGSDTAPAGNGGPAAGGAIASIGVVTLQGGRLDANQAVGGLAGWRPTSSGQPGSALGGAVSAGTATLTATDAADNEVTGAGGGAVATTGGVQIDGGAYVRNSAGWCGTFGSPGGAVGGAVSAGATSTVTNASFVANKAAATCGQASGGALDVVGDLTVQTSRFEGNQAYGAPGAAWTAANPIAGRGDDAVGGSVHATGAANVTASSFTLDTVMAGAGGSAPLGNVGGDGGDGRGGAVAAGSVTVASSRFSPSRAFGGHPDVGTAAPGAWGQAFGGALWSATTTTVVDASFTASVAVGSASSAGAAVWSQGDVQLSRSTVSGSTYGDGAVATPATLTATSSTFDHNETTCILVSCGVQAGSVNAGVANLVASTLAGDGGGPVVKATSLATSGSVLARDLSRSGVDCLVTNPVTSSSTWANDISCALSGTGDVQAPGGDPLLGALTDNGGPTPTRLPALGSPLLDAIAPGACPVPTDQRGAPRPSGPGCDIGAVERDAIAPPTTTTSSTSTTSTSTTAPPPPGALFHAVTPFRLVDSRDGTGVTGPIGAGGSADAAVAGVGGIPASATAVVMNVTVTGGTAASFLTAYPTGEPVPLAANLLFAAGQTVPNLVTVKLGAGGHVSFFNQQGGVQVVADVVGWYDDGSGAGDGFVSVTPSRILDSRTATGGWPGPLGSGASKELQVVGVGVFPVPPTATAVVMNVTVTGGSAASYLQVSPSGTNPGTTANLLFAPGQTVPNLVTVGLGTGAGAGKVTFFNQQGSVDVVADVVGYYAPGTGSRFHPVTPSRLLDSRSGVGLVGAWGPDQTRALQPRGPVVPPGTAGYPCGTTCAPSALALNVTVTGATTPSYLRVTPNGGPASDTANLLFGPGQTVPNAVITGLGSAWETAIYNQQGSVHVIADVAGYFSAS